MTIDEFEKEAAHNLKDFLGYWRSMHETSPEDWPLEIGGGDWWEQFIAWENKEDRP